MDPCWKNLPCELVYKICNMLTKVRRIDERLGNEIRHQWNKLDMLYYNAFSLFGREVAWFVIYDDMKIVNHVPDVYPDEMPIREVVCNMWKASTPEERDNLSVHY